MWLNVALFNSEKTLQFYPTKVHKTFTCISNMCSFPHQVYFISARKHCSNLFNKLLSHAFTFTFVYKLNSLCHIDWLIGLFTLISYCLYGANHHCTIVITVLWSWFAFIRDILIFINSISGTNRNGIRTKYFEVLQHLMVFICPHNRDSFICLILKKSIAFLFVLFHTNFESENLT